MKGYAVKRQSFCSVCGTLQHNKMCSVYWAWTWPTGDRRAYKQLLCVEDAAELGRLVQLSNDNDQGCAQCDRPFDTAEAAVTLWFTAYPPGLERIDGSADYHASCWEDVNLHFIDGATRLDNRVSGRGAPRPDTEISAWARVGLVPRQDASKSLSDEPQTPSEPKHDSEPIAENRPEMKRFAGPKPPVRSTGLKR